jgi:predicted nucleotidyltransferase
MLVASSNTSIDSITSVALSRLVYLEESLRGVHARQRKVLRESATLEVELRGLLDCDGFERKCQSTKMRELASLSMKKSCLLWNQFYSRSKVLKSSGLKAQSVQLIRNSSKPGFSKWSRYKLHAQRQVLFNVKKQLYISRRAQLPSNQISRKPPVTLEDYVNQTKLMELLRYELPDAEELGITEK